MKYIDILSDMEDARETPYLTLSSVLHVALLSHVQSSNKFKSCLSPLSPPQETGAIDGEAMFAFFHWAQGCD